MHAKKPLALLLAVLGTVSLTACVSPGSKSGSIYDSSSAGVSNQVAFGKIIDVREVLIDKTNGTTQAFGTAVGGTVGATAGNSVAKRGSGYNVVGAAVGAGIGAYAGDAAMRAINTVRGYEMVIRLENGQAVSVTQEDGLPIGTCAKITYSNQARVSASTACR